jgi:hypothetical protein
MEIQLICENHLDFLNDYHKSLLNKYFQTPPTVLQTHDLAISLGLEESKIIAIIATLSADRYCRNWLLIYHNCSETFVDRRPLNEGMIRLPYRCPYCEFVIEDFKELKFDLMVETNNKILFI